MTNDARGTDRLRMSRRSPCWALVGCVAALAACATKHPDAAAARRSKEAAAARQGSEEVILKLARGEMTADRRDALERLGIEPSSVTPLDPSLGWFKARTRGGTTTQESIDRFARVSAADVSIRRHVLHVQQNVEYSLDCAVPNDLGSLYGMVQIRAPAAWDMTTGSAEVVVAVIDSGIDTHHHDLRGNLWRNPRDEQNGRDDDGNGWIDDVFGIDPVNRDGDPSDDHGHGTRCAGTVGAVGNNALDVVGVCWTARLMSLKFARSDGRGFTDRAVECYRYAIEQKGNKVPIVAINNSWGTRKYDLALLEQIEAAGREGILSICSAGNEAEDSDRSVHYPSGYESEYVVSVASSNADDQLAGDSNYGPGSVDIVAPGEGIESTKLGGGTASSSGTSMAAPHVSGAVALILSRSPNLPALKVRDAILKSADQLPQYKGRVSSNGRLNLEAAIRASR